MKTLILAILRAYQAWEWRCSSCGRRPSGCRHTSVATCRTSCYSRTVRCRRCAPSSAVHHSVPSTSGPRIQSLKTSPPVICRSVFRGRHCGAGEGGIRVTEAHLRVWVPVDPVQACHSQFPAKFGCSTSNDLDMHNDQIYKHISWAISSLFCTCSGNYCELTLIACV